MFHHYCCTIFWSYISFRPIRSDVFGSLAQVMSLARGDVNTNWGGVPDRKSAKWSRSRAKSSVNLPVLEELQAQAVGRADLNALRSACGTRLSPDCVAVSRLRSNRADLVLLRWCVVPAGLLVSGAAELGEDKAARAGVAERRGLQLGLLREEEDGAAALALV